MRVAAVQMAAGLGEVDGNLDRARHLVEQAVADGAEWILLPEFFTTAMAFNDRLLEAARPLDGEPTGMLLDLARRHGIVLGGSFLAIHPDGKVRNTFVLAGPDGVLGMHDKDLPTMWENCYYEGGHDDGVIQTPVGPVGAVVCWEFIRTRTAKRLLGRVRLVGGGSCWWDVPENLPPQSMWRAVARQNRNLWRRTLPSFARAVGVPIVHANWCGRIDGRWALGTRYVTRYVADAAIIDADGRHIGRRSGNEGAGVLLGEIELREPKPSTPIPDTFWLHAENRLPHWRLFWWLQNAHGRRYRRRMAAARTRSRSR